MTRSPSDVSERMKSVGGRALLERPRRAGRRREVLGLLCGSMLIGAGGCVRGGEDRRVGHTLRVERFGEGAVFGDGISCGEDCAARYSPDTSVELDGEPAEGFYLASWTGCDAVSGSACFVTMDADRSVFPTFASVDLELSGDLTILDDATMSLLVRSETGTLYFDSSATTVAGLATGNLIGSAAGKGLLFRVASPVTTTPDGLLAVVTSPATLEDAILQGTLLHSGALDQQALRAAYRLRGTSQRPVRERMLPGCEVPLLGEEPLDDLDGDPSTLSDTVTLLGQFQPEFDFDFAADYGLTGVKEVRAALITRTQETLTVVVGGSFHGNKEIPVVECEFQPVPVAAFVTLSPKITISVGVEADAAGSVSAAAAAVQTLTAGVHYRKNSEPQWQPIAAVGTQFDWEVPIVTGEASVRAYVRIELEVTINEVLGPYVGIEPGLRLSATPLEDPWWTLYFGLSGDAGARVEILGWTLADASFDLFDEEWPLAQAATAGPPPPSSLPDLTAAVGSPPSSVSSGQTGVQVPVTVSRSGGELTTGEYVLARLFWSADTLWDAADVQVWQSNGSTPDFPISGLNADGSRTVTATFNVPSSPNGTRYLIAVADPTNYHAESNEGNNIEVRSVTVQAGGGGVQPSDLIVEGLSVSPGSGAPGSAATVFFTIRNQGLGSAAAATTNVRLSPSAVQPSTSDPLLAPVEVPALTAGATHAAQVPVSIPSVASGSYYVWVIADVGSTANQSDETNDRASTPFTVVATNPEVLSNGSFSSGTSGWTLVGDFWAGTNLSSYRTSPGYSAGGVASDGAPKNNASGWMYQTVAIPGSASNATLTFWHNITSQEGTATAYDFLNVTLQDAAGNFLATVRVLSNKDQGALGAYSMVTFDASPFRGTTVRVNFLATTDGSNTTVFRVDDVSLTAN